MRLALLICANPKLTREGTKVHIPEGEWFFEKFNVKDSKLSLMLKRDHSPTWDIIKLESNIIIPVGKNQYGYVVVDEPGSEVSISLVLTKRK